MKITTDLSVVLGVVMALSFVVNIAVQLTKGIVPIPTKLWCVIVAVAVNVGVLLSVSALGVIKLNVAYVIFSIIGSFIVAYIAMYGFDTFKELWERFRKGADINE
jgi:multidrug transporter EmrE-like cation transporter